MSAYKFVTREDLGPFLLNENVARLLAEREVYREVAICQLDLYDFHNSETEAAEYIDAEAVKLLEGK